MAKRDLRSWDGEIILDYPSEPNITIIVRTEAGESEKEISWQEQSLEWYGQEPKNTGRLWKPENARNRFSPKASRKITVLSILWFWHYQTTDLQNS